MPGTLLLAILLALIGILVILSMIAYGLDKLIRVLKEIQAYMKGDE